MNVLDLFSGACGGWSLGLERAGFTTIAACEIDPWRRERYAENFPGVRMYDDVRTLTAERLRADGVPAIDVVVGSPPCQDASVAQREKRTGIAGERTGLFREALRLVRELRPRWVFLENVTGLVGVGADGIAGELETAGYECWVFNMGAEDFGATHERRRLWFIAMAHAHKARLEDAWCKQGQTWAHGFAATVGGGEAARNPWRQGESAAVRMAHGVPNGLARKTVAAYGDAIVPAISEAIGRALMRLEHG